MEFQVITCAALYHSSTTSAREEISSQASAFRVHGGLKTSVPSLFIHPLFWRHADSPTQYRIGSSLTRSCACLLSRGFPLQRVCNHCLPAAVFMIPTYMSQ